MEASVERQAGGRWVPVALFMFGVAITAGLWHFLARSGAEGETAYFGRTSPPPQDVLRYTNGAEPETLDPALMSGQPDGRVATTLFEGLVVPDPETLEPRPGMARSWDIDADGVTYRFHLRTNSLWTNGDPVTARDFEWSWLRVLHPDTPARYADLFYLIRSARAYKRGNVDDPTQVGIRALDDSTFRVVLNAPTPYFLQLLTYYPFLPVHRATVERYGDRWTHPEHIVSNGPFRLTSHRQNDRLVFDKFPGYWDADNVSLQGIVAYSIDDPSTMLNMYRAGMTDWNPSGYVPAQFIPYVVHYRDYRAGPYLGLYFYSVVVTHPPFDDRRVRQALALAIDREKITRYVLHDSVEPWGNIVAHGFRDYPYPQGVRFDPEKARQLLRAAGFPGGEGFPEVELLFNTSEDHRKIAEAIHAMWKEILGIQVRLSNQEWASYMRATVDRQYEMARRSWIADYADPNSFLAILRTEDGNNRTNWGDPQYDALLAEASREPDRIRRLQLLARAEAIALEAMPYIPIYAYRTREFVAPYVRGMYATPLDAHPLKFVSFDRRAQDPHGGGSNRDDRSSESRRGEERRARRSARRGGAAP